MFPAFVEIVHKQLMAFSRDMPNDGTLSRHCHGVWIFRIAAFPHTWQLFISCWTPDFFINMVSMNAALHLQSLHSSRWHMLKHQYTRVECNFVTSLVLDSKSDKFKTLQIPFFKSAKFVPANISRYTVVAGFLIWWIFWKPSNRQI